MLRIGLSDITRILVRLTADKKGTTEHTEYTENDYDNWAEGLSSYGGMGREWPRVYLLHIGRDS